MSGYRVEIEYAHESWLDYLYAMNYRWSVDGGRAGIKVGYARSIAAAQRKAKRAVRLIDRKGNPHVGEVVLRFTYDPGDTRGSAASEEVL